MAVSLGRRRKNKATEVPAAHLAFSAIASFCLEAELQEVGSNAVPDFTLTLCRANEERKL